MRKTERGNVKIMEDVVARYYELHRKMKEIEKEMTQLKQLFNAYFDEMVGPNMKGELCFDGFKLQRQVRIAERYIEDKTVQKLEALRLNDCIQTVKRPDRQKIEAAMVLGLLSEDDLEDCKIRKVSQAIYVREA